MLEKFLLNLVNLHLLLAAIRRVEALALALLFLPLIDGAISRNSHNINN